MLKNRNQKNTPADTIYDEIQNSKTTSGEIKTQKNSCYTVGPSSEIVLSDCAAYSTSTQMKTNDYDIVTIA